MKTKIAQSDKLIDELRAALFDFLKVVDAVDAGHFENARGRAYAAVLEAQKYRDEHPIGKR